jgi:CheY-like chemotaxis protein
MDHAVRTDRTALVVDDDVFVVSALAEILDEEGYDVHTATNGFSALRRAAELKPAVILLDLFLPERSGIEVLHDLRSDAATRDVAIVVVTGHPDALSETQIAETDDVIAKPFDVRELVAAVQRAVQRAATRRAEVAPITAAAHRVPSVSRRKTSARPSHGRR